MSYGPNHGTAESSSETEGGSAVAGMCDVTSDCDTLVISDCDNLVTYDSDRNSLPQVS